MTNDKGRLKYSLYFGTKHIKGLEVMKDGARQVWQSDRTAPCISPTIRAAGSGG